MKDWKEYMRFQNDPHTRLIVSILFYGIFAGIVFALIGFLLNSSGLILVSCVSVCTIAILFIGLIGSLMTLKNDLSKEDCRKIDGEQKEIDKIIIESHRKGEL